MTESKTYPILSSVMSTRDAITIDRKRGDGRYNDLLDVASALAPEYGNATNALAVLVRQSPLYAKTMARLRRTKKKSA